MLKMITASLAVVQNSDVLGSNPDRVGYLSSGLCIHSASNCPKACAVLCMVLCTINKPSSHSIWVGNSPDFRLPSVALLAWLCRKRRKAIFTHYTQHCQMIVHLTTERPWSDHAGRGWVCHECVFSGVFTSTLRNHDTLNQCSFNVGPLSRTLAQH